MFVTCIRDHLCLSPCHTNNYARKQFKFKKKKKTQVTAATKIKRKYSFTRRFLCVNCTEMSRQGPFCRCICLAWCARARSDRSVRILCGWEGPSWSFFAECYWRARNCAARPSWESSTWPARPPWRRLRSLARFAFWAATTGSDRSRHILCILKKKLYIAEISHLISMAWKKHSKRICHS